jgi:hypothetical protein
MSFLLLYSISKIEIAFVVIARANRPNKKRAFETNYSFNLLMTHTKHQLLTLSETIELRLVKLLLLGLNTPCTALKLAPGGRGCAKNPVRDSEGLSRSGGARGAGCS